MRYVLLLDLTTSPDVIDQDMEERNAHSRALNKARRRRRRGTTQRTRPSAKQESRAIAKMTARCAL